MNTKRGPKTPNKVVLVALFFLVFGGIPMIVRYYFNSRWAGILTFLILAGLLVIVERFIDRKKPYNGPDPDKPKGLDI
jgi:membrane protein implicated in regulation of membrane protease activity